MRVLVAFGSKRGGTEGIAAEVATGLRACGAEVDVMPARRAPAPTGYDAVVIGGALYASRWHHDARRYVMRHEAALRGRPTWLFSSGPLDDTARTRDIPPVPQVERLMARIGAQGHATFGGRLEADARGFVAARMARTMAGDWRDLERVRAWATTIGAAIETCPRPAMPAAPPSERLRLVTMLLCLFTALTALAGAGAFIAAPDGHLLGATTAILRYAVFSSFFWPGVILAGVGLWHLGAAFRLWRRHPEADDSAFVAGGLLIGWIIGELILVREFSFLQVVYLAVGVAIVATVVVRRFVAVKHLHGARAGVAG